MVLRNGREFVGLWLTEADARYLSSLVARTGIERSNVLRIALRSTTKATLTQAIASGVLATRDTSDATEPERPSNG